MVDICNRVVSILYEYTGNMFVCAQDLLKKIVMMNHCGGGVVEIHIVEIRANWVKYLRI